MVPIYTKILYCGTSTFISVIVAQSVEYSVSNAKVVGLITRESKC